MVCRVDLCHQPNDDDEDEGYSPREALLEKMNKTNSNANVGRRCCSFRSIRTGSRQKIVILVKEQLLILWQTVVLEFLFHPPFNLSDNKIFTR